MYHVSSTTDGACTEVNSKPGQKSSPVANSPVNSELEKLKTEVKGFHRRFNDIIESTICQLNKSNITVTRVVFILTTIFNIEEHKTFLTENKRKLNRCRTHQLLFGELNMHWDYLAFDLLEQLLEELAQNYRAFYKVRMQMQRYSNDMLRFRKRTSLELFCEMYPSIEDIPLRSFQKRFSMHQWPQKITLETVEKFRKIHARTYNLKKCALMCSFLSNSIKQ